MQIKMIATDLDRTLLRTDKTISEYSAKILNRCRDNDIKVVFATARPKRTVKSFLESVKTDAVILHNGAVVYMGEELFLSYGINSFTTKEILLSLSRDYPHATLSVEIDDVFYANFDVSQIWNYTTAIMSDFTDLPDKPADKIIIGVTSMDDMEQYKKYIPNDLYIEMSDGKLGLIMNRKARKYQALQAVAAHYGLETNEIAAFGDDYNDVEMIKHCGAGIAMENALSIVKQSAKYICGTNDNDGVAKWIEQELLSKTASL